MTVLVVDDQSNVVGGIISGVHWSDIGVTKVVPAYNAFEAKQILLTQRVDIMLCDIEMPVENGLALFRWVQEQGLDTECIFLTAHADFYYAKEAVRLGGFDYILQPARYEDIQASVLRAIHKVETRRELQEYSSYGKMMYRRRDVLLEGMLKGWYCGEEVQLSTILEDFEKLEIPIHGDTPAYYVLIQLLRWNDCTNGWNRDLVKYAFANILSELFAQYGQKILLVQLDRSSFAFLSYAEESIFMDESALKRQLTSFWEACANHFHCEVACYAGPRLFPSELTGRARVLLHLREQNVALASGVFFPGDIAETPHEHKESPNFKRWESLLTSGYAPLVGREAKGYLDNLAQAGTLDADTLQCFYQSMLQILCSAAEDASIPPGEFLPEKKYSQRSLNNYLTIDDVKGWLDRATRAFQTDVHSDKDTKGQMEQIVQYIQNHIERDIRRTEIAEEFYLNPDYLSRLFKKKMGVQLKDFIVAEKMKVAQDLLRTTALPVSMVAAKVGYSNFSHFSQVYKKVIGRSPAEDRASQGKNVL